MHAYDVKMSTECIRMWCISMCRCQESWHKGLMKLVKGKLRGSTEVVLTETLPRILLDDSVNMSDKLILTPTLISSRMLQKAKVYLANAENHIRLCGSIYVVRRFKAHFDKLTNNLIKDCARTLKGQEPQKVI